MSFIDDERLWISARVDEQVRAAAEFYHRYMQAQSATMYVFPTDFSFHETPKIHNQPDESEEGYTYWEGYGDSVFTYEANPSLNTKLSLQFSFGDDLDFSIPYV
jgi:hypothetical protein